jgi:tripartite-type tricarboxylate transporter receptor subunit TctC
VSRFIRWAAPCSKGAEAKLTGAGGMTGAVRVAKAAPDGYQFVIAGPGIYAFNRTLYKNPPYNAATDFAPVGLFAEVAEA